MDKEAYKMIKIGENPLKIDKDLLELQKTIIHQGDKIVFEIDKLSTIVRTILQQKDKNKALVIEKSKEDLDNPVIRHLRKLKIPPGYKGYD